MERWHRIFGSTTHGTYFLEHGDIFLAASGKCLIFQLLSSASANISVKYVIVQDLIQLPNVSGQIVHGIQYIHKELRILHGFISADNVIVSRSGSVQLGTITADPAASRLISRSKHWSKHAEELG